MYDKKLAKCPMTIAQNVLLLYVPFLVFVLRFLALVIIFLFRLEKIFKFKNYHNVLKGVLEDLKFVHLKAGYCNAVAHEDWIFF